MDFIVLLVVALIGAVVLSEVSLRQRWSLGKSIVIAVVVAFAVVLLLNLIGTLL